MINQSVNQSYPGIGGGIGIPGIGIGGMLNIKSYSNALEYPGGMAIPGGIGGILKENKR